jgi:KUP system potassium uptake protein
VYGDIGTSVLYAVKEVFGSGHVPFTPDNVYGILSIFFWTLTVIVSIKYVGLVLRADNHGEGGLVAMLALASQSVKDKPELRRVLLVVGASSEPVCSMATGSLPRRFRCWVRLKVWRWCPPPSRNLSVPLTLVILLALFMVQKHGTASVGKFFGPVMVVWFIVIAAFGRHQYRRRPPHPGGHQPPLCGGFMWNNPGTTFIILGAVVLCVTGGEALYADMGHFGKKPIRVAWFSIAMPALTLNYFGQGALLLHNPLAVKNPFFMMAPDWALIPLVAPWPPWPR